MLISRTDAVLAQVLLALVAVWITSPCAHAQPVAWSHRTPAASPSPRYAHSMIYDSARQVVVAFGGQAASGSGLPNNTWTWDGTTWTDRGAGISPARTNSAMAFDEARGVGVLFGGGDGAANGVSYGDTWLWNGTSWARVAEGAAAPSPRNGHAMAYDSIRGVVVLFGGFTSGGNNDETWLWDGTQWMQTALSGPRPSARNGHLMTFDPNRGRVVLFGGTSGADETWEWDGIAWTQAHPTSSPSGRGGVGMTFDDDRGVVVLVAGSSITGYSDEYWEWNGSSWLQRTFTSRPSARFYPGLAFDRSRRVGVLFGGSTDAGATISGETWEFVRCVRIDEQPASITVCRGGTGSITVVASGSGGLNYQWRRDGEPISPVINASATTAVLVIPAAELSDQGLYDCVVGNAGCGDSATSLAAELRICLADFNCSGSVSVQDIFDFLAAYFAGEFRSDINASMSITVQDIFDFIAAYFAGCS